MCLETIVIQGVFFWRLFGRAPVSLAAALPSAFLLKKEMLFANGDEWLGNDTAEVKVAVIDFFVFFFSFYLLLCSSHILEFPSKLLVGFFFCLDFISGTFSFKCYLYSFWCYACNFPIVKIYKKSDLYHFILLLNFAKTLCDLYQTHRKSLQLYTINDKTKLKIVITFHYIPILKEIMYQ